MSIINIPKSKLIFQPHPKPHNFRDLTDQSFGFLTALGYVGLINGRSHWLFKCACGLTCCRRATHVTSGATISCGCKSSRHHIGERSITHSLSADPRYGVWVQMVARCTNPDAMNFHNYGRRGITVCKEWLHSVEQFFEDMGIRPEGGTLERIDNSLGYYPANTEWRTQKEQMNNTRRNIRITINGITKTMMQWCAGDLSLYRRANSRRQRGWCLPCCITANSRERCPHIPAPATASTLTANGRTLTVTEWSANTGIKRETLFSRIRRGYCTECVISLPKHGSCTHRYT